MPVIINASPTNGLVQTADGSGIVKVQSNGVTTNALAWVNFNGSDGSRNASYNVSSVTRNGTGDYTVTFTNAMADVNYVSTGSGRRNSGTARPQVFTQRTSPYENTTLTSRFLVWCDAAAAQEDPLMFYFVIFGN
jgi:hypothetical protein